VRLRIVDGNVDGGLADAHVLVLGTGGLNAGMIPHLCGLGIGQLTLLDKAIGSLRQVTGLLDTHRPDVVVAQVDSADDLRRWVNDACAAREIPLVCTGMWHTEAIVWSVDPGLSGCLECAFRQQPDSPATRTRANQGIGRISALLSELTAFEILRILTRFEEPAYAANSLIVDFANGYAMEQQPWPRDPTCPVCGPSFAQPYR
jgi:molybdopterin-synthase adenylyltransferase